MCRARVGIHPEALVRSDIARAKTEGTTRVWQKSEKRVTIHQIKPASHSSHRCVGVPKPCAWVQWTKAPRLGKPMKTPCSCTRSDLPLEMGCKPGKAITVVSAISPRAWWSLPEFDFLRPWLSHIVECTPSRYFLDAKTWLLVLLWVFKPSEPEVPICPMTNDLYPILEIKLTETRFKSLFPPQDSSPGRQGPAPITLPCNFP